jgi:hypothetical protein
MSYLPTNDDPVGIDLREELESLRGYSFSWFALRQPDFSQPCAGIAHSDLGHSPVASCSRCQNTGYLLTDFIVGGKIWIGQLGVMYQSKSGLISTADMQFILEHNRPIGKGDLIGELEINGDTGQPVQPFRVSKYYRVANATKHTGDDGKIIFWRGRLEENSVSDSTESQVRDIGII